MSLLYVTDEIVTYVAILSQVVLTNSSDMRRELGSVESWEGDAS
jgi:hypothetical protein